MTYFDMRLEIGKIVPIKSFVRNPFYIRGLDFGKMTAEHNLPNFTIYFSNDRTKLINTISGKSANRREVASLNFKGGGKPANLFLPEIEKRWPVFNYCYLAIDRLTETSNAYLLFEIRK